MPDSFYDIKGNEISKDGIVSEFINNYTGNLTDFNEGSEIRNLLEAFAVYAMGNEERMNDLLYAVDIMNADGEYLDLLASQPRIDMERIEGVEATGTVLFTIRNALLEELLIPAGTIVTAENGMDFETVTDNIIMPGELGIECMVEAIEVGVDGNIPAGSILTKIDGYDAVEGFTVTNEDAFSGGVDYEEDDVFRDRIIEEMSLQKFGSRPYYKSALANEYPEAHDILFTTPPPGYHAWVIPNTYDGDDAQSKLTLDVASYLSNENNIMLGHKFYVTSPSAKTLNISFIGTAGSSTGLYIALPDYSTDTVNKAKQLINAYFTGSSVDFATLEYKGLNLKEEWSMNDLTELLSVLGEVTITEVGDAHSLNNNYKYSINYVR